MEQVGSYQYRCPDHHCQEKTWSLLILKESEDGWNINHTEMDQRCGFTLDEEVSLTCHGEYFAYWDAGYPNSSLSSG